MPSLLMIFFNIVIDFLYYFVFTTPPGCLLGAAVCIYPLSFSSGEVMRMCGPTARQYNVGECSVRWAYVLAIIGEASLPGGRNSNFICPWKILYLFKFVTVGNPMHKIRVVSLFSQIDGDYIPLKIETT